MNEKGLNPKSDSGTVDLENFENRERIERYVSENLPETEQRIEQPMHPECGVSIVIPACKERDYVLRCLDSFASQEGVSPNQFEAIFVINNSSQEPPRDNENNETLKAHKRRVALYHESLDDNQETLKVLRDIQDGNTGDLSKEEREIAERVKQSGIHFFVVDKASSGKELPLQFANVGGARNRGTAEAVSRFLSIQKNGIIAHTDADARLNPDFMRNLIDVFAQNPDVVGVAGGVKLEALEGKEAVPSEYAVQEEMRWAYRCVVKDLIARKMVAKGREAGPGVEFFGPSMAGKAFETALVNGIKKTAGGEDTNLGERLSGLGKIINAPEVLAFPADRESARTSTGQGKTRIELREDIQAKGEIYVHDFSRDAFEMELGILAQDLFKRGDVSVDSIKQVFLCKGEQLLSDEELQDLSSFLSGPGKELSYEDLRKSEAMIRFRESFRENLDKLFPKVPLQEAADSVRRSFMEDEILAEKYKRILEDYMKHPEGITTADIMPAASSKFRENFISLVAMRQVLREQ